MRLFSVFSWVVLLVMVAGCSYLIYEQRSCVQPIYYSIGTFDTKFGISKSEFLAVAERAADLWNQEAGHTVIAYNDTGSLAVNLVYDSRQQATNTSVSIQQQQSQLESEKSQIAALEATYKNQQTQYYADRSAGANPATLNAEASELNQLESQIQSQITNVNQRIRTVNSTVATYNSTAGQDFEEGVYVGTANPPHIDLYEFKNETQLERLIAHEFGHALSLDHDSNVDSIMYPENDSTSLTLSAEDKAELHQRCMVFNFDFGL